MLLSFSGSNMFSIDQGNPSMNSDDHGQTWYVCSWGISRLKGNASTQQLRGYLEEIQGIQFLRFSPAAANKDTF